MACHNAIGRTRAAGTIVHMSQRGSGGMRDAPWLSTSPPQQLLAGGQVAPRQLAQAQLGPGRGGIGCFEHDPLL